MAVHALFPDAIDRVTTWFEEQGPAVAQRLRTKEDADRCRIWRLDQSVAQLCSLPIDVVLKADFPASSVRLEVSKDLCLRYPHVEADGHLCHGVQPEPDDFRAPVEAVGKVLARLEEFLHQCQNPDWVDGEFHRERQDYWVRYAALNTAADRGRHATLLLDVDVNAAAVQELAAISLGQGARALATSATSAPEKVALARGWHVGTIVRGACLVVRLPEALRWTPITWPRSFDELDEFLSSITGVAGRLRSWFQSRRWPNKAPVSVALLQGPAAFGWRLHSSTAPRSLRPTLVPIQVNRIDRQWSLSRDHHTKDLSDHSRRHVAVLGCGSLGSQVVELLARAGVGRIDVVDPQIFLAENLSRHLLGIASIGTRKAEAVCTLVERNVPGATLKPFGGSAAHWLANRRGQDRIDAVVDCTGERSVRMMLSRLRSDLLTDAPVVMAWMEPQCAAAHVVVVTGQDPWPTSDPAETEVNVAVWPDEGIQVNLPGCGEGFHPYGMADSARAAGLAAERILTVLANGAAKSGVWSMVRSRKTFEAVSPGLQFNVDPPTGDDIESVTWVRALPTGEV